ncbi:MAG: hypothetical protein AB3P11_05865 [Wolbachia pipientis]
MQKYEELNETQKGLYDELKDPVSEDVDISTVITKFSENDFLPVLTTIDDKGYTLLNTFEAVGVDKFKAVLSEAQKQVLLEEVVNGKILSSNDQDEVKSILVFVIRTTKSCRTLLVISSSQMLAYLPYSYCNTILSLCHFSLTSAKANAHIYSTYHNLSIDFFVENFRKMLYNYRVVYLGNTYD